jgi:hypothetical protein
MFGLFSEENLLDRNYWLNLFTDGTWKEFQGAGGSVTGFRESRWHMAHKIAKGDYFLCYLSDVSRFVGVLEARSGLFKEQVHNIWKTDNFTCRFKVRPIVVLSLEMGIPLSAIHHNLSFFSNPRTPHGWTRYFRSSPVNWKKEDGEVLVRALLQARDSIFDTSLAYQIVHHQPE